MNPRVRAATAARARILPHGPLDLVRQLAIWFGFLFAYRYTRGVADRDAFQAFQNGLRVADFEHRITGLWELSLQSFVASSRRAARGDLAGRTGTRSSPCSGSSLLWVYLRRNEHFVPLRNTILLANVIGLVGFVLMPTAPPRMFPELGFVDTLADFGINHDSAIVRADANPYAAMPSLHAADALIIGVGLFFVVPLALGEGALAALAALGLVLRDGDRQPLLARHRGRHPRRARRGRGRQPQAPAALRRAACGAGARPSVAGLSA